MLISLSYRIQHTFTSLLGMFLLALGSRDGNPCATEIWHQPIFQMSGTWLDVASGFQPPQNEYLLVLECVSVCFLWFEGEVGCEYVLEVFQKLLELLHCLVDRPPTPCLPSAICAFTETLTKEYAW